MKNLLKTAIITSTIVATPVMAETWATADCTLANGGKIRYIVHESKGYITYDGDGPYEMFTKREGNMGIVTHIGNRGNMVMAVDLNTGRGYIITKFDDGRQNEKNVSCRLGAPER